MLSLSWYQTSEAFDDYGNLTDDQARVRAAELALMAQDGVPQSDLDAVEIEYVEVVSRDEAVIKARVPESVHAWVFANAMVVDPETGDILN